MSSRLVSAGLLLLCLMTARPVEAQGRRLKPIPKVVPPAAASPELPPLPDAAACRAAVHRIAATYGGGALRDSLHREFPNRDEVIDALNRANLHATSIELLVESINGTRFTSWQRGEGHERGDVLFVDCLADVSTRLVFDDPATGERIVRPAGRGEWRVRFESLTEGAE